jgi:large subunit ribosomal protein L15
VSLSLNNIRPAVGSKSVPKRLGRGIGSGTGKTAGRGHKGQHARSGGFHKVGFEGGQTPLHRRLPKFGFHSHKQRLTQAVRLGDLSLIPQEVIDLQVIKEARLLRGPVRTVKVIATGKLNKPIKIKGLKTSMAARKAIENIGGSVEV